eukprot:TRINITY_DN21248_c0_g1_i1.p1 TRINITY_DN21248_c0_g1~~TRINITY_DN21248_c0_g1_i1.p1  ORF type:complete len:623 (+),score=212.63 TRINITY_DN21248_c0_g1_i1:89-1957(+)
MEPEADPATGACDAEAAGFDPSADDDIARLAEEMEELNGAGAAPPPPLAPEPAPVGSRVLSTPKVAAVAPGQAAGVLPCTLGTPRVPTAPSPRVSSGGTPPAASGVLRRLVDLGNSALEAAASVAVGDDDDRSEQSFSLFETKEWTRPDEDSPLPDDAADGDEKDECERSENPASALRGADAAPDRGHEYTVCQAGFHVFKANVGAAIFSLSAAYTYSGAVVGTLIILGGAVVCVHCMLLLVECKQKLGDSKVQTYGEVAWRAFGKVGRRMVCIFLVVTQLGFCCVYFQFAGGMLGAVLPGGQRFWMMSLLLPACLLCFLPSMKRLIPAAVFATVATIVALCAVSGYSLGKLKDNGVAESTTAVVSPFLWPVCIGNVVSAFEGIGLVLPIENSMRDKESFPRLLVISFCFITFLYISIAAAGYAAYGTTLAGSIITVLPHEAAAGTVRLCMAVAILLTYPIQFFPAIQVIEGWVFPAPARYQATLAASRETLSKLARLRAASKNLALRVALCSVIALLAVAVGDQMGLFLALIGGLGGSFMAIIMPPLLHLRLVVLPTRRGSEEGACGSGRWWTMVKDCALVGIGLTVACWSTYMSAAELVHVLSSPEPDPAALTQAPATQT